MPPKSGKGGKKLTKAEKERLKKEEEEKRSKEEGSCEEDEEEARLRAEREAHETSERERYEAEERRRLENEERKRRKGQLQDLEQMWETNRNTLKMEQADLRKAAKWDRYMKCDGSPNPTIQGEINTYMSLWKEDMNSNDIANVLQESRVTLSLIDELNFIMKDTPQEELIPEDVERYKDTIEELQTVLHQKLELASHDLLMKATELADSETGNLQFVIENDKIVLCMWGNISKNPRIKQYEFEQHGFMFDIPKILCLSDCAVRTLFTKFDHLSPQCRTYLPRQKCKIEEEKPDIVPEEQGENQVNEGEEGEEEGKPETTEGGEGEPIEALIRENSEDVMAALKELEAGNTENADEEQIEEGLDDEYDIKTPELLEWEDFEGDDDAVDLRASHIMGGIFHFNLLQMPHQPRQVRDWIIVQVEKPPRLSYMDYVADGAAPPTSARPTHDREKEGSEDHDKKREDRPSIAVTIRLPQDVYFCEEPQVVRWNEESKEWRLDGFFEHIFIEGNRLLNFKTSYFGTMALIQDTHINMPFQSWNIRPHEANSAIFTVTAAIVEVEIEIKDALCSLIIPESWSELQHLADVWLEPKILITRMRECGLNIFPSIDSSKYVNVHSKNPVTEDRLYQQMALTASSMAYSWSKWNSDVKDDSQVVIQGTEHLEDEPLLEEDWSLFLITKKRVTKLKMTEFDERFSCDHQEGTEFHADLYHMAVEMMSEPGKERVNNTSHEFVNCIYTLLSQTRIITYS